MSMNSHALRLIHRLAKSANILLDRRQLLLTKSIDTKSGLFLLAVLHRCLELVDLRTISTCPIPSLEIPLLD